MELLLKKLREIGGMKAAAVLRLVCKAWLTAFTDFSGSAQLSIEEVADKPLERLCKMMPRLSDLSIRNASQQLDVSPLASCSHLTKLQYNGMHEDVRTHEYPTLNRDLSLLPKSLRELEFEGIDLDQGSFSHVNFTELTKLICAHACTNKQQNELWDLLQCLPALKVALILSFHATTMTLKLLLKPPVYSCVQKDNTSVSFQSQDSPLQELILDNDYYDHTTHRGAELAHTLYRSAPPPALLQCSNTLYITEARYKPIQS